MQTRRVNRNPVGSSDVAYHGSLRPLSPVLSRYPVFLTTEHTEHTERNPPAVMSCFRVFGVFRGSLVFGGKSESLSHLHSRVTCWLPGMILPRRQAWRRRWWRGQTIGSWERVKCNVPYHFRCLDRFCVIDEIWVRSVIPWEFLLIWVVDQRLESIAKRFWEFCNPTFTQKSNLDHV